MTGPSIRLVVPYFGERPSYMPLVVKSMAHNPDVHWLRITDEPYAGCNAASDARPLPRRSAEASAAT